jgi:beta-galactosidase
VEWAGVTPTIKVNEAGVQARLHKGNGGTYLWVTNPMREERAVKIEIALAAGSFTSAEDIWGKKQVALDGQHATVTVQGRDAAVIRLL